MIDRVADIVRAGQKFLLMTHRGPDGDGLGSMVGCAEMLRALGKQVTMMLPDGAPEPLRELAGVREAPRKLDDSLKFDATFVFDTGDPRLLQNTLPKKEVAGTVVVIDHHRVAVEFGDVCWRDPEKAAVGVMVFELATRLGVALSTAAAEALFVSLVSDTGSFRYANTDASVLRIAAELVDRGAQPWKVTERMQESQPLERLALLRRVLGTIKVTLGGKLATLEVSDEMLKEAGATAEMVEGMVNYARGIRGVEVGALLSRKGNQVRASLRGRGHADVARVCAAFGGGGHHDAAGCEIGAKDLAAAREILEAAVKKEFEQEAGKAEA
jgi:phosphoesterase RecJ-like protein